MRISEVCIKRPVFTTMIVALPVVLGIIAMARMGVDLFPNVDMPVIIITTSRPGTSVEEMESGVTKVIEESVNTLSGIDELRSTTNEGICTTVVQFTLEKNRDIAQQEVQGKINTILQMLPTGTQTPIVDKVDLQAMPVLRIAVAGKRSLREVTEIADKNVSESLSSLSGVGSVILVGGLSRAVNITIDTHKLEQYNLSIDDVRTALASQNLELPGGRIDQNSRELVLRTMGRVVDPKQINDLIVKNVNNQPVRIRDVGAGDDRARAVEDTWAEERTRASLDGTNSVFLIVQKQSGTDTVVVIDRVKAKLAQMEEAFAAEGKGDIHMYSVQDQSRFINASLHEVKKHLILGALLVSLTILLFLRDWRTMVIASLAIPTSLIATFSVMRALDFTINNITMLGMVLAVGIVIDDAVVVHENIFRWMEEKGKSAWDAAMGATKEIGLAVMATTSSLVVIFLPIAFMEGRVGRFFYSFGITIAVAIVMSFLVSFTLTPMLASRFLRLSKKAQEAAKHGKSHHSGGMYGWLAEKPYLLLLRWSMRHRWVIVVATILVTMSAFPFNLGTMLNRGKEPEKNSTLAKTNWPGLFKLVGLDFMPKDDQSEYEIAITTPQGWTLQRTDLLLKQIEKRLHQDDPEHVIENVLTTVGNTSGKTAKGEGDVTTANVYVRLIDLEKRETSQFEMMDRARKILADYPDLRASIQIPSSMGSGGTNADVEFALIGPDFDKLIDYSEKMVAKLRQVQGLYDVDTTLALRKPELRVTVNRDKAADLGVSILAIGSTLRTIVGGQIVSDYKDPSNGEQYDIWLRAEGANRNDRAAVAGLTVPSAKGITGVRLDNVADLKEERGPAQIDRFQRLRKISIVANKPMTFSMNLAEDAFRKAFDEVQAENKVSPEYQLVSLGRAKVQGESIGAFIIAFAFSLIFMYMILAAQFESFVHPITILLAVPLTIPFALMSLLFLGQPLTIYSMLGLFLLFGIVKKNGILQIDYTNALRKQAAENEMIVPGIYRDPDPDEVARLGWWARWTARQPKPKRIRLWATMEANRVRLRPILMTTCMLIAGMIPIALGTGPGSASRASMAKVIVGGQALSLLLSLLVTPVAYALFDDLSGVWARLFGKKVIKPPVGLAADAAAELVQV